MNEREEVAAWVRRELAARGWTQQDLADRVGVSAPAVGNWVRGLSKPSPAARARVEAAFRDGPPAAPPGGEPAAPAPEPERIDYAGWVRRGLDERGWTQSELADEMGMTPAAVSLWATGRARPSRETLARLEALLGPAPGPGGRRR